MPYVDLLKRLPKTQRNIEERRAAKTDHQIAIAKRFGYEYFDGPREYGYGGYKDDGRWYKVASDIIEHFGLPRDSRFLDIGCAKGFLVKELVTWDTDAYGIDISSYAVKNCHPGIVGRLHLGNATHLPFPAASFDAVISINALHNLSGVYLKMAIVEMMRVCKYPQNMFIQVDSFTTEEERDRLLNWVLTAETIWGPEGWTGLFAELGYQGDYCWTIV